MAFASDIWRWRKLSVCLSSLVTFLYFFGLLSAVSDDGATLLAIKKSFRDSDNVLYNWIDSASSDHCSWRGVTCDNVTFAVVALNLSHLNLGGEISPVIGNLKSLESIDLKGNGLSGQIPDEIGDCSALKILDVSLNYLYGDIPFSISKLKQLEQLIVKNNQLMGPIPSTLSQIPNLKKMDFADNQLSGEIPRLIYWNEVLQYLGLRNNFLVGTLSPDMCQLTGLWFFDVRGNNLSGTIPENIGNCTSYAVLDLSYNQLTGEIPFNIGFLQVATLSLQGNKLTGRIPEVIGLMQALTVLDLSDNHLTGTIPSILGNLTYTDKLYLHSNNLTGSIPPELGNMTKLGYLQLNDNQLTGQIPPELGNLEQLFELNLARNQLEGPIPENISSCVALIFFNVHGNRLNGTIPLEFQKLNRLTYLNLSSNNITGTIPVELGHIINLDRLDISNNNISGPIPRSIGNMEHLLKLNLSGNKLSGFLPADLGNLRSIGDMDLSANQLSGPIPSELGQLQNLVSLILNNNSLSGEMPWQLTNCFSLTTLNLSYNNLSGNIPVTQNFTRFTPESFFGNPGLCGYWIGSLCGISARQPKASVSTTAIVCISLGSVILVCVITIALYLSNQHKPFTKGSSSKTGQGSPRLVILHMDMALYMYDDIMRMTENLNEKFIIGNGATSTVYRCDLKNCKPVAIKRLYTHYPQSLREFETELETVGSIKHRNLVSLRGYSLSPHGNLLFYDYMVNGSLWDILHGSSKKIKLDWNTRLRIALGAAQGLAYLHHDCNPRIIHRDVKTSNILLDDNFEAHLSDFGIAKCIPSAKTHASTYVMGTIGYIDPEYARTLRLNEKSDVYSYGIVLLELLTGRKPVDNDSNLHQLILSKADNNMVMETVDPEVVATCIDLETVRKIFQLALLCTKRQPSDRPTMHDVARVLQSLLPTSKQAPSSRVNQPAASNNYRRYLDEYTEGNHRDVRGSSTSSSTSDGQLFVRFGEVISQNIV